MKFFGSMTDDNALWTRNAIETCVYNAVDIGQETADLIASNWLDGTLAACTSYFTGDIKYGKVGDLVIVYLYGSIPTTRSTNFYISTSTLPSGYRPSAAVKETNVIRTYKPLPIRVTTSGYIYLDAADRQVAASQSIRGEIAFTV